MGYRLVCDKCGASIDPTSSRIVIGYNMDGWDNPTDKYDLCVSCAMRFRNWMNSSYQIAIDEKGGGKDG